MGVFLKYFERLSYVLSQGVFVSDVAVLYPVAPFEAGLDGEKATQTAFATARALMAAGISFEFIDADSLARAEVREGRLNVVDSSYRVLIFPAMEAVRWSSLEKAAAFARSGGRVLNVGTLPLASDQAGRDDRHLDNLVAEVFGERNRLANPVDVPAVVQSFITPDVRAEKPVRSLHRRVGPREVYFVMDAPKNSPVEFRAKGKAELWDPWTGSVQSLQVLSETATGTVVEMPLEKYESQLVVFTSGQVHVNPPKREDLPVETIRLESDWEFELKPTMDNRYGDFRLPITDQVIGAEARTFRHARESGNANDWREPGFDDSAWERVTTDFGPQFWVLGPVPAALADAALDRSLAGLASIEPGKPVEVSGQSFTWRPYQFSWRQGLQGDPGHQGWHGLKENVTDHFLCLGKRTEGLNESKYEPEIEGGRYYVWTSATVPANTKARFAASLHHTGPPPHASMVLTPAALYLNGRAVEELGATVSLRAGSNPLLVRYDHAGRGYLVLRREDSSSKPTRSTPLSMTWFDDPAVIRFNPYGDDPAPEWFRFTAPPGFRSMKVTARGTVQAWVDGQLMQERELGRFDAVAPTRRAPVVAMRVVPNVGASGGAVFPEPVRLDCGPGVTGAGDWSKLGALECYSGGAWYRKTVTLTPERSLNQAVLDLGKVVATAEVRVNGEVAGVRVAPPWRVDVSRWLRPGENQIEVLVFNTLANHYSTIPTRYQGNLTSGLIGPVKLELRGK
ncbi:MAG: glycosyl hydrolase [Verrucomicrobiia bacterium]